MARGDAPLVRSLPARPGQKELRYVQLLSGPYEETDPVPAGRGQPETAAQAVAAPGHDPERFAALEAEVASLKEALARLEAEFSAFRRQFE